MRVGRRPQARLVLSRPDNRSARPETSVVGTGDDSSHQPIRCESAGRDGDCLFDDVVAWVAFDDVLDLGYFVAREDEEPGGIAPYPLVLGAVEQDREGAVLIGALADEARLSSSRSGDGDRLVDLAEERLVMRELAGA